MSETQDTSTEVAIENAKDIPQNEPDYEPEVKKQKTEKHIEKICYKLEEKLNSILCCTVCLDLPNVAVYQVRRETTCWAVKITTLLKRIFLREIRAV